MKITIDTVNDSKEDIRKAISIIQNIIGDEQISTPTTAMTTSSDFTPMPTSSDILNDVLNNPIKDEPDEESKEEELGFVTY